MTLATWICASAHTDVTELSRIFTLHNFQPNFTVTLKGRTSYKNSFLVVKITDLKVLNSHRLQSVALQPKTTDDKVKQTAATTLITIGGWGKNHRTDTNNTVVALAKRKVTGS